MYCMRVSLSQLVSAAPYRVAAYQVTQGEPSRSRATEDDILACRSARPKTPAVGKTTHMQRRTKTATLI
jgi:hypothetical protein